MKFISNKLTENVFEMGKLKGIFGAYVLPRYQKFFVGNEDSICILEEDWDNLIILDACRVDLFEEVVDVDEFDGYTTKISAGSGTREWVKRNFKGQAKSDIVYVTGSPVISRHIQTAVHAFYEVWKKAFDTELRTIPPEPVKEAALNAKEEHPDKRMVVHFMQPHYPFIGNHEMIFTGFRGTDELSIEGSYRFKSVWEALDSGVVSVEECWRGYRSNLETVLAEAFPLLNGLPGKNVMTSDHGNLIRERPPFAPFPLSGHPNGVRHPNLDTVPWAWIDNRKPAEQENSQSRPDVETQLRALGYK